MTFFLPIFWALKTLTWQPGLCGCFLQLIRKTAPRNMHAWSVCYNNMNMTLLHIIWPSKCDQNSLYVYYIWHTGARLKHLNFRNHINQKGGTGRAGGGRVSGMFCNTPGFWTDRRTNRKCVDRLHGKCQNEYQFFLKSLSTLKKGSGSQVLGSWEQWKISVNYRTWRKRLFGNIQPQLQFG